MKTAVAVRARCVVLGEANVASILEGVRKRRRDMGQNGTRITYTFPTSHHNFRGTRTTRRLTDLVGLVLRSGRHCGGRVGDV